MTQAIVWWSFLERSEICSTESYIGIESHPVAMPLQVPEVKVTAQALLPSTSVISFTLGNGLSFTTFVNTVPINENRTINRFALIRCEQPVPPATHTAHQSRGPMSSEEGGDCEECAAFDGGK